MQTIHKFIDDWCDDALNLKPVFSEYFQELQKMEDVLIEFNERPGVSYSLRGIYKHDKSRPLFTMIDVIDDDPKQRWLSVCFYGDTIEDPEEKGDLIPEGLLGEDGYCFDLLESDVALEDYVRQRIRDAYHHVCGNAEPAILMKK